MRTGDSRHGGPTGRRGRERISTPADFRYIIGAEWLERGGRAVAAAYLDGNSELIGARGWIVGGDGSGGSRRFPPPVDLLSVAVELGASALVAAEIDPFAAGPCVGALDSYAARLEACSSLAGVVLKDFLYICPECHLSWRRGWS